MLKSYYYKVKAVRITKANYQELLELDTGDGVLSEDSFKEFEGDWFVETEDGYTVWAGNISLIPVDQ